MPGPALRGDDLLEIRFSVLGELDSDAVEVYTSIYSQLELRMRLSARDLRKFAGRMFRAVRNGRSVTLTFRGREIGRVVPAAPSESKPFEPVGFGLWKDRRIRNVASHLDRLRRPRYSR